MDADTTRLTLAALTLCCCIAIAALALFRVAKMSLRVQRWVRIKYSLLGVAAIGVGLAPWYGEWPGWSGLGFSAVLLVGLLMNHHQWRHGAPTDTYADQRELE
jgi:hypothetical protein